MWSGLAVVERNWQVWLVGAVSRVGAGVVAWTGKTWFGTSLGTGTGGQGLVLGTGKKKNRNQ